MSGQVRQAGKAVTEIYRALHGTRESRYGCLPVDVTTKLIGCSCSIPCLMLGKYTLDLTHVVDWGKLVFYADGTFEEGPVRIRDSREQVLRGKTVRLVKVLWQHRGVEEATWEHTDTIRTNYPFLFENEGMFFCHLILNDYSICM